MVSRTAGGTPAAPGRTSPLSPVGLALEAVVEVEVPAAPPGQEAGEEVRRQHERPPPLELADVDVLVVPRVIQTIPVLADDDVAQAQCRRLHEQAVPQEEPGEPAVHLDHPSLGPHPAA